LIAWSHASASGAWIRLGMMDRLLRLFSGMNVKSWAAKAESGRQKKVLAKYNHSTAKKSKLLGE
jgi:hypothetical protein